jgi:hypothetical protein
LIALRMAGSMRSRKVSCFDKLLRLYQERSDLSLTGTGMPVTPRENTSKFETICAKRLQFGFMIFGCCCRAGQARAGCRRWGTRRDPRAQVGTRRYTSSLATAENRRRGLGHPPADPADEASSPAGWAPGASGARQGDLPPQQI